MTKKKPGDKRPALQTRKREADPNLPVCDEVGTKKKRETFKPWCVS